MNKEGTIYTIIFIFLVSFAFVFLLSLTNQGTIERVELNEELVRQRAILSAMGIEADGPDEVQDRYGELAGNVEDGLYVGTIDGTTVYATQFAGAGLWGTIEGVLAVTSDLGTIVGLEIVRDNETPGLGGRINDDWFKEQFRGERVTSGSIEITQVAGEGDPDPSNGAVDGVTGATRTSEAMQSIVNQEFTRLGSSETMRILESLAGEGAQS